MKNSAMLIMTLILMSLFGCQGFGRSVKVGEPFTLKMEESARVRGADIKVTVIRVGRKWLANGGGESLDFSFSVKHDGKTEIYSESPPSPLTVGDYKIEIVKTEPFDEEIENNHAENSPEMRFFSSEQFHESTESVAWFE